VNTWCTAYQLVPALETRFLAFLPRGRWWRCRTDSYRTTPAPHLIEVTMPQKNNNCSTTTKNNNVFKKMSPKKNGPTKNGPKKNGSTSTCTIPIIPTIHSPSSDPVINRVGSCSLIHAKEVMRVPGRLQFENLDNFFPDLNKSTGKRKRKSVSLDPTRQLYSHKEKDRIGSMHHCAPTPVLS
jgi:hypothetical protein